MSLYEARRKDEGKDKFELDESDECYFSFNIDIEKNVKVVRYYIDETISKEIDVIFRYTILVSPETITAIKFGDQIIDLKEIPYKDRAADSQSDFWLDCTEIS